MIIVRFMGGVGNQMFQYAVYKRFFLKGRTVTADLSWYALNGNLNRKFELEQLGINLKQCTKLHRYIYSEDSRLAIDRIRRRLTGCKRLYYREEQVNWFQYDEEIYKRKNVYLDGYWQNRLYFRDIEKKIISDFDFSRIDLKFNNMRYLERIRESEAISIHVRGGDYLNRNNIRLYGNICTSRYYEQAIRVIKGKVDDPVFFVFSNDIEYAKSLLSFENCVFVEGNTENDALEEMKLMINCKHNIIANSSFSWWAATINQNPEKIVIAPQRWMNIENQIDIVADGWLTV